MMYAGGNAYMARSDLISVVTFGFNLAQNGAVVLGHVAPMGDFSVAPSYLAFVEFPGKS